MSIGPVELRHLRRALFSDEELETLDAARRRVNLAASTVAYCSYEGPYSKAGGLYQVAAHYCRQLLCDGGRVLVITPHHRRLRTAPAPDAFEQLGECQVRFGGRFVSVKLLQPKNASVTAELSWVHLSAEGFFEAAGGPDGTDPYAHAAPGKLLQDSLFASAALPFALAALGHTQNVVVHLQDWEFAAGALTLKLAILSGLIDSAVSLVTMHNPYDHALPNAAFVELTDRATRNAHGRTVYQCMLPLTDAPVSTVSKVFGRELITEPAHTLHFASHLQSIFRSCGVVGVDNGLFGAADTAAFSNEALARAKAGNENALLLEKAAKRRRLLDCLENYQDPRILGHLEGVQGGPLSSLPHAVPIFLMFGRLDPTQKGFDLLTRAIEALPRGFARFILTPVVNATGPFLDDLADLAQRRSGEVVVYPFRMQRGYAEALAGASYAVMPSLYEPFGGATEAYLAGTPVVARATGGLCQQVSDVLSGTGSGFVFREGANFASEDWTHLLASKTPQERNHIPLYGGMVAALSVALTRAGCMYTDHPEGYAELLMNLDDQAKRFSWSKAAREYGELYAAAVQ